MHRLRTAYHDGSGTGDLIIGEEADVLPYLNNCWSSSFSPMDWESGFTASGVAPNLSLWLPVVGGVRIYSERRGPQPLLSSQVEE